MRIRDRPQSGHYAALAHMPLAEMGVDPLMWPLLGACVENADRSEGLVWELLLILRIIVISFALFSYP